MRIVVSYSNPGREVDGRVVDHLQGAGDLHALGLCSAQDVHVRNAVSGRDGAQHEFGAGRNIDRGVGQTPKLEKDWGSHCHCEPPGGL